jgi:hypothetical protein
MTLPSIRDWYNARKGTVNGIPVEHISANIVSQYYLQPQCDEFINDLGITLPANDYNTDSSQGPLQTNAVHDSFTLPFTKPLFVIINCVSNSPSHRHNVVMLNQSGAPGFGTQADWEAAMTQWRALMDSVQAAPPELTGLLVSNGGIRFNFPGQRGRTNQVMVSSNLTDWTVLANFYGTNGPIIFRDTNIHNTARRFYRLRRL